MKKRNARKTQLGTNYSSLEPRHLLATVGFDANTGVVTIFGDSADNSAQVLVVGAEDATLRVNLDAEVFDFEASEVQELRFIGADGNDQFRNLTEFASVAWGGNGADLLVGGMGNDRLVGQGGEDQIIGRSGDDTLLGNDGDDTISGNEGDDIIWGGLDDDLMVGHEGDDFLGGNEGDDTAFGNEGEDVLKGFDGEDELFGGMDEDRIFGGMGDDITNGGEGDDDCYGGYGDDFMVGGLGDDFLHGFMGIDMIIGGMGNDQMAGGEGNDTLEGNDGDDVMFGGDDADEMDGGLGADRLFGQDGEDQMFGGLDSVLDQLFGGLGMDSMVIGESTDIDIASTEDMLIPIDDNDLPEMDLTQIEDCFELMTQAGDVELLDEFKEMADFDFSAIAFSDGQTWTGIEFTDMSDLETFLAEAQEASDSFGMYFEFFV